MPTIESNTKRGFKKAVSNYFHSPLRIASDLLLLTGAVLMIVGLCLANYAILISSFAVYLVAVAIAIVRCVLVMRSTKKHQASHKTAFANIIVMGVLAALCIFGLIYAIIVA